MEKEVTGKYNGHLFGEKYKLNLKDNGKFVKRVVTLEPFDPHHHQPEPVHVPLEVKTNKNRHKTKGSWVYFKKDSLDGIILKTTNQIDSLYFLENGNLSPIKPSTNTNDSNTSQVNDSTDIVIINYKNTSVSVIGVEYEKK